MNKNYSRSQGNWQGKGGKDQSKVLMSFEKLDITQGQSLREWNNEGDLLLKLTEINATLNKTTYSRAITDGIIEEYDIHDSSKFSTNNMPKSSKWKYPLTLTDKNVKWCKIRLGSTRRVIGYLEKDVFYIVFLDKDHQFYPTEPNNT
ncbi:hypothetical protein [Reichenbachiella sp. MSK19-1]|uniref:hypothetical protein n=1 Tax=Reichenbachiella sp. MSK19-1 TaxID=1897631 RepID=UPI000E6CBA82|nr:hypothetical protein [Reichenbachiella sp. MSK19-1]RJE72759.1 hypothetical protein BGP76_02025 [Reichenbachiella sp. MSK19-1]